MKSGMKWGIGVVIVAALLFFLFRAPDYPDTIIPKPVRGNPSASIIIEEFSDFQCPACGAAHPVLQRIIKEYGNEIQLQYKQFPLTSVHPRAFQAAEGSECANDQGKFWEFGDIMFTHQDNLEKSDLKQYAADLGLDVKLFSDCLSSGKKAKIVSGEQRQGIARNVQGTPTFFVNGEQLRNWNYESFKTVIEQKINATS